MAEINPNSKYGKLAAAAAAGGAAAALHDGYTDEQLAGMSDSEAIGKLRKGEISKRTMRRRQTLRSETKEPSTIDRIKEGVKEFAQRPIPRTKGTGVGSAERIPETQAEELREELATVREAGTWEKPATEEDAPPDDHKPKPPPPPPAKKEVTELDKLINDMHKAFGRLDDENKYRLARLDYLRDKQREAIENAGMWATVGNAVAAFGAAIAMARTGVPAKVGPFKDATYQQLLDRVDRDTDRLESRILQDRTMSADQIRREYNMREADLVRRGQAAAKVDKGVQSPEDKIRLLQMAKAFFSEYDKLDEGVSKQRALRDFKQQLIDAGYGDSIDSITKDPVTVFGFNVWDSDADYEDVAKSIDTEINSLRTATPAAKTMLEALKAEQAKRKKKPQ